MSAMRSRLSAIYNSADAFVLPSLEDNLPNTIMESMACGVPSIGFRVGGIPEMIDHQQNGYVANYRDTEDLASGIHWVLEEADTGGSEQACLQKVAQNYSQHAVALKYIEVYNEAMAYKNYKYMIKFTVKPVRIMPRRSCSVPSTACSARPTATSSTSSWMAVLADRTLQLVKAYQHRNAVGESSHEIVVVSEPDKGLYDAMNRASTVLRAIIWCLSMPATPFLLPIRWST